jgi:hypothetical protein
MAMVNGNNIDPKAYAARVTKAKKAVAAASPEVKAKLKEYYPKITKKDIAKQMIGPKTSLSDMEKRIKAKPTPTPKPVKGMPSAGPVAKIVKKAAAAKPTVNPKAGVSSLERKMTQNAKAKAAAKKADFKRNNK